MLVGFISNPSIPRNISYILEMSLGKEAHIPLQRQTGHSTEHVEVFKRSLLMSASFHPHSALVTLIAELFAQKTF